jgi:hypothetical protein
MHLTSASDRRVFLGISDTMWSCQRGGRWSPFGEFLKAGDALLSRSRRRVLYVGSAEAFVGAVLTTTLSSARMHGWRTATTPLISQAAT